MIDDSIHEPPVHSIVLSISGTFPAKRSRANEARWTIGFQVVARDGTPAALGRAHSWEAVGNARRGLRWLAWNMQNAVRYALA